METKPFRESINYWFGESATHMLLFAQDDNGKTYRVQTTKRTEQPFETEHRLICMMKKKHGLITAY